MVFCFLSLGFLESFSHFYLLYRYKCPETKQQSPSIVRIGNVPETSRKFLFFIVICRILVGLVVHCGSLSAIVSSRSLSVIVSGRGFWKLRRCVLPSGRPETVVFVVCLSLKLRRNFCRKISILLLVFRFFPWSVLKLILDALVQAVVPSSPSRVVGFHSPTEFFNRGLKGVGSSGLSWNGLCSKGWRSLVYGYDRGFPSGPSFFVVAGVIFS